jgi:PKD repeat protein
MLPEIKYPDTIDDDTNLYLVKDSIFLKLATDYVPGDTFINVEFDAVRTPLFPSTGIITLTEQCSEPEERAVSFYYTSFSNNVFSGLTILPSFKNNTIKPAVYTTVVMNVMAEHHNSLKNTIIQIELYAGKKITNRNTALTPQSGTIEERITALQQLAYEPRAWFSFDTLVGLAPLTVHFTNESIRLGEEIPDNTIEYVWDFGDSTASNINYTTSQVCFNTCDVGTTTTNSNQISHTYTNPGIFTVSLTVKNDFGQDSFEIKKAINVKYPAPDQAIIYITAGNLQQVINGTFKSPTNLPITIYVPSGYNPSTGETYAGEPVNSSHSPLDPIVKYTWQITDDIDHANSSSTIALFSVGGIYDISLRCDTKYLSYRITNYLDYINIIENTNLWLFTFFGSSSTVIQASEMGFLSETFKTKQNSFYTISTNNDFLKNNQYLNESQLTKEFSRNTNFRNIGTATSGYGGTSLVHYASGRAYGDPISNEKINCFTFNGFYEVYSVTGMPTITRPWNWVPMNYDELSYFILGNISTSQDPGVSLTNWGSVTIHNTETNVVQTGTLSSSDFVSQATLLQQNATAGFSSGGVSSYGYFSSYRQALRDDTYYILKNDAVGTNFRIKSFFSTYQDPTTWLGGFKKLPDILGPTKLEGELVNMQSGIYFFNNTGAISSYDTDLGVWRTGGPGLNSVDFLKVQDTDTLNYDDETNSLLACGDGSNNAYISYDYSPNSFIKFNDLDLTFTKLNGRPEGSQWNIGTY